MAEIKQKTDQAKLTSKDLQRIVDMLFNRHFRQLQLTGNFLVGEVRFSAQFKNLPHLGRQSADLLFDQGAQFIFSHQMIRNRFAMVNKMLKGHDVRRFNFFMGDHVNDPVSNRLIKVSGEVCF